MKRLPLGEFQQLIGLSDRAMMWLLRNRSLVCVVDQSHGLMLEVSPGALEAIVASMREAAKSLGTEPTSPVYEQVSRIISDELEEMVTEAIARIRARSAR